MTGCVCRAVHPLQGLWEYLKWLALFRFCQRHEPSGHKSYASALSNFWFNVSQLIFVLGMLGGASTLVAFLALSYTTVHAQVGSGEPDQPTVSSLCPGVWAGLFLFGNALAAGHMHYSFVVVQPALPLWRTVLRSLYFAYLLVCAVMTQFGAASYYNAATVTRIVAAYWTPMALIAFCISVHAAIRARQYMTGTAAASAHPPPALASTSPLAPVESAALPSAASDGSVRDDQVPRPQEDAMATPAPDDTRNRSHKCCARCCRGFACGLSWLLCALFTVLCFTFSLHQVTSATGGHPMPGRLYGMDVGTVLPVQMQAECQGQRTAAANFTIWLEHGGAGAYIAMAPLATELAPRFRVCGYSRAGNAWSQGSVLPRTSDRLAAEAQDMMRLLGEPGPYVFVGHSSGGQLVQLLAHSMMSDTVAVVALDSVPILHWWTVSFSGEPAISDPKREARATGTFILRVLDLARFLGASTGFLALGVPTDVPEPWSARARWAAGLDSMWETQYVESYPDYADEEAWESAFERETERMETGRLADVPLLMVPAGMVDDQQRFTTCEDEGLSGAECDKRKLQQQLFFELQERQANTSTRGSVAHCPIPCEHNFVYARARFVADTIASFLSDQGLATT